MGKITLNKEDVLASKEPIYKGCTNKECFCTGACKEIIGWKDKPKQNEWNNKDN